MTIRLRTPSPPQPLEPAGAPPPRWRDRLDRAWRAEWRSLLAVVIGAGLVGLFFMGLYLVKRYPMPIGWDTPRYLGQTNFVAARGLRGVPALLPPPTKTLASRAAFPVTVLTLSSLFTVSTFKLAAIVPVAASVSLALAAGALVSAALRRSAWELLAVTAIVGLSPMVVRLMAPETYTDNLLAAALFVAALVPMLTWLRDREGYVPAAVLLGTAGVAHSPFFGVMLAVLGLAALAYVPTSWRAWRRDGTGLLRTPSAGIAEVMVGGTALAAATLFGVLRAHLDAPKLTRGELSKKFREDLPLYLLPVTGVLAAGGAASLAAEARRRPGADGHERFGTGFLLAVTGAWIAVTVVGVAAFESGRNVPAHRFLAFLVALPILIAALALWLSRWAGRRFGHRTSTSGPAGRSVTAGAAALVVAVVALGAFGAHDLYTTLAGPSRGVEWLEIHKVQDAATAAFYLQQEHIAAGAPVVFVIDDSGPNPLSYTPEEMYIIRSVLPAERIEHAYAYVGNPLSYLAGRPTQRDQPKTYDANEQRFWPTIQTLLPHHPVALLLSSFNPLYGKVAAAHPDWVVAPNVLALNGPHPAQPLPLPPTPSGPHTVVQGAVLGGGTMVVLVLIGLGWAIVLLPRSLRPFEVFALSPAAGIAALLLAGIAVDAVGIRLAGLGGTLAIVLASASGWGAAWYLRAREKGQRQE